jgi:hypothetical protein
VRRDFAKVVNEPARRGGHERARHRVSLRRFDPEREMLCEALPTRELRAFSRTRYGRKSNAIKYSAVKRFLLSRLGKPWNRVYAEACRVLRDQSSRNVRALFSDGFTVEQSAFVGEDGEIYERHSHFGNPYRVTGFYVHPVRRTLEYEPREPTPKSVDRFVGKGFKLLSCPRYSGTISDPASGLNWSTDQLVARIDQETLVEKNHLGLWFVVELAKRTAEERIRIVSSVITPNGKFVTTEKLPPYKVVARRQASSRELKRWGLINDRPAVA